MIDGQPVLPPRMILLSDPAIADTLKGFERAAMTQFLRGRRSFYPRKYDTPGGSEQGYRYAQPLFATVDCVSCHSGQINAADGAEEPAVVGALLTRAKTRADFFMPRLSW